MRYHTPISFADAAAIAAGTTGTLRFLAGGTDVLVQLRAGMVQPDDPIDLKHIPGVDRIEQTPAGGWKIGIAVPGIVLGAHEGLVRDWPGVVEGMNLVGSTQVQGRATLAGNLCNGSPAADSVPGLFAAGAVVTVTGPKGSRDIPVEDVPAGPGKAKLAKGEVISAITLPPRGRNGGDAYLRFIVEELKPRIDATFRTKPGREHTAIAGSSMGGLISLYAAAEYPDVFGRVGAVSTHWPVGDGLVIE